MHPILEDRRRLALYLLAWLLAGVLLTIGLQSEAEWLTSAAVPVAALPPVQLHRSVHVVPLQSVSH